MQPNHARHSLARDLGADAYVAVLDAFMEQLPGQVADLDAAAAVGDVPRARYVAHQLIGTAVDFGAVGLDDLARRILSVGPGEDAALRPIVELIGTEVDRLRAAHHPRTAGSLEIEVGPAAYAELLDQFIGRLPQQVTSLTAAAATGDLPWARYIGHELIGTAGEFGAAGLNDLAHRLMTVDQARLDLLHEVVSDIVVEARRLQAGHDV
ncbi:MAG: hypothetical protein DLM59_13805 [Pseudonocardiales bacterium]|nr:MAG: hypothetical protein DLM59_13805 [Pseudonocardiales bacterium]